MDEILRAKRQHNAGSATRAITIRGAREHNLKNVDVEIPRDKLAVFTGLSGSGKSSLAFDTIYAEGQRRYVESLSAYARQFLEMMQKPDVDHIDGLSPAISIEQKTTSEKPALNRRHGDGNLRLLAFAVCARRRALFAGNRICQSRARLVSPNGRPRAGAARGHTACYLLAPVVRGRKGEYKQRNRRVAEEGLSAPQDQRHGLRDWQTRRSSIKNSSTTSMSLSTASWCGRISASASRQVSSLALILAEGQAVIEYAGPPPSS